MRIAVASAALSVLTMIAPVAGVAETVTWDGADTGGDQIWTDGDNGSWSGDTYDNGDDAHFLGAGLGTVTVAGAISPASVTVDAAGDYTFVSNAISGGGNLTKSGAGTLTLRNKNTYTGGTTVNGGTLELAGGASTLASGGGYSTTVSNATLKISGSDNNIINGNAIIMKNGGIVTDDTTGGLVQSIGVVTFDNGGRLTSTVPGMGAYGNYFMASKSVIVTGNVPATIDAHTIGLYHDTTFNVADVTDDAATDLLVGSILKDSNHPGEDRLVKTGAGTMTLTNVNTYTGGTIVNDGVLELSGGSGRITGALTVEGSGTVKVSYGNHNNLGSISSITLQNGGTLTDNSGGGWVQSVNMPFTFNNGGTLTSEPGTPGHGGWGNFLFGSGFSVTGTGLATISANGIGFSWNGTVTVDDTVAGPGTDLLISSSIRHDRVGTVTKVGAGTVELTGINTDPSPWAVNAGTLLVNSTLLGAVTVNSNATVGGVGTISGVVTNLSDGHIAPGTNSTGGTLTLAGGLTLNDGSILDIDVDTVGGTGDAIVISGGTFTGAASSGGVTVNVTTTGEEALFYDLIDWSGATGVGVDLSDFNVIYNGEDGNGRLSLAGNKLRLRAGALGMMMFVY
jgi:fibronectin-binding autotransporter adhesin